MNYKLDKILTLLHKGIGIQQVFWTTRWIRCWNCCAKASAYNQFSERDIQVVDVVVDCFLRSMCNLSPSWRVSWHHARRCIRTCRRSQNNWISSLSSQSLLTCGLPFTVFYSFTLNTFWQEHWFHSNKHIQKCFLVYYSLICIFFHLSCAYYSPNSNFSHKVLTLHNPASQFIGFFRHMHPVNDKGLV